MKKYKENYDDDDDNDHESTGWQIFVIIWCIGAFIVFLTSVIRMETIVKEGGWGAARWILIWNVFFWPVNIFVNWNPGNSIWKNPPSA